MDRIGTDAEFDLDLVVIVTLKTSHHSKDWAQTFKYHLDGILGVVDLYRIVEEWDYLIKAVPSGTDTALCPGHLELRS